MTQADNAQALRMSLDSGPAIGDQGQAVAITAPPDVDRRARRCCECGVETMAPVLVALNDMTSGPPRGVYADRKCAVLLAASPLAPQWLRDMFPKRGELVRNALGETARFMGWGGAYAYLRPVGGGKEYEVRPETLRRLARDQ